MTSYEATLGYPAPPITSFWRLKGWSGRWYVFSVYAIDDIPPFPISTVYAMAGWRPYANLFNVLYIGEAVSLYGRFVEYQHEKLSRALQHGATHLLAHFVATTEAQRLATETDLRHAFNPPLNEQPVPARTGLLRPMPVTTSVLADQRLGSTLLTAGLGSSSFGSLAPRLK